MNELQRWRNVPSFNVTHWAHSRREMTLPSPLDAISGLSTGVGSSSPIAHMSSVHGPRAQDVTTSAARTAASAQSPRTVAFVHASYRPDSPDETDRATAMMATALRTAGHRALVITARRQPPSRHLIRLNTLPVAFPCDEHTLRSGVAAVADWLRREMNAVIDEFGVDTVVHVDPLWGLGRAMPVGPVRRVLAVADLGRDEDLRAAVANRPDAVIIPSRLVQAAAGGRGYDSSGWRVVPNALLACPPECPHPGEPAREWLRTHGPVRVVGPLSALEGVLGLLAGMGGAHRRVDLMPTDVAADDGGPLRARLAHCEKAAAGIPLVRLHRPVTWRQLPGWLAEAAMVVIPSQAHTFGMTAAEAMCSGTPVVAYAIGGLPDLVGSAGVLVPPEGGPGALWSAIRELTEDQGLYAQRSYDGRVRAVNFRQTSAVDQFMRAVW
jgi:glycosyltransferase involved in cell wall biosynthesis